MDACIHLTLAICRAAASPHIAGDPFVTARRCDHPHGTEPLVLSGVAFCQRTEAGFGTECAWSRPRPVCLRVRY
jgi:hypothetical protein